MATCPKCQSFYFGKECLACAAERKQNPEQYLREQEVFRREKEREDRLSQFRDRWLNSFFVSTTPLLDGYEIKKYCGVVTGSVVLGTGFLSEFKSGFSDLFGTQSAAFSDKLEEAKHAAMEKARDNALALEANALIGIDIDFHTFSGNLIAAVVSGTAVYIERSV